MPDSPVTVITPSLPGREQLLERCRASVAAQTIPVEHLWELDEQRVGPAVLRNRLAGRARTDWLLLLDDDDTLDPTAAQTLTERAGDADIVYPWCRTSGDNQIRWIVNKLHNPASLFRLNYLPNTVLIKRDTWEMLGGNRAVQMEDWDLWRRAHLHGCTIKCVPEILWTYQFHGTNTFQR